MSIHTHTRIVLNADNTRILFFLQVSLRVGDAFGSRGNSAAVHSNSLISQHVANDRQLLLLLLLQSSHTLLSWETERPRAARMIPVVVNDAHSPRARDTLITGEFSLISS